MKRMKILSVASVAAVAAFAMSGASRAEDAAAAAGTSAACFNKGLYAAGAVVDYEAKIKGGGATQTVRVVNTAKPSETYQGETAIPVDTENFDAKGKSQGLVTSYYQIDPAFLLILGTVAKDAETTYDPAGAQPIDQKKGATYKQKYEITTTSGPLGAQTTSRQATWKFAGTETLKSKVGKFKVCKITAKFVDKIATFSTTTNLTIYVAAEGKYRGFALRTKSSGKLPTGQPVNTTSDVVKFRKFKPK